MKGLGYWRCGHCRSIDGLVRLRRVRNAPGFLLALLVAYSLRADPGTLDTSFDSGTTLGRACCIAPFGVESIALQPDGMILVAGEFKGFSGDDATRNFVARLDSNGLLDSTFNAPLGTNSGGWVNVVLLQPDGKILIAGSFTSVNNVTCNRIARLHADSTLDDSFNSVAGADNEISAMSLQKDGKLVIGGSFANVNGTPRNHLARLNPDGSLDAGFDPGAGANERVYAIAPQGDGKLLVGGMFTSIDGTNCNRVARLNANGSLDTSFAPPSGIDDGSGAVRRVLSILTQPDGKALIGGWFSSANGQPCTGIVRLAPDGTTDTSFNVTCLHETGLSGDLGFVNALALQPDGKIIVVGNFQVRGGAAGNGILRLNSDGSLDAAFTAGGGGIPIQSVAIQSDGRILVGGDFTSFASVIRCHLARLGGDPMLHSALWGNEIVLSWPASYTNYALQQAPALSLTTAWAPTTNLVVSSAGQYVVTNQTDSQTRFYRLTR